MNIGSFELVGYSERGVLGSLLTDIVASGLDILTKILGFDDHIIKLPENVKRIQILLEPSLSDFGDPDAVIILDGSQRHVIFVEAKAGSSWCLSCEFQEFSQGNTNDPPPGYTSNLFTQLYLKERFVSCYDSQNNTAETRQLPKWLKKKKDDGRTGDRSLGENPTVKRMAYKIMNPSPTVSYLALIPSFGKANHRDSSKCEDLSACKLREKLETLVSEGEDVWRNNMSKEWFKNIAFITWKDIDKFCMENECRMPRTSLTLSVNCGQLYEVDLGDVKNWHAKMRRDHGFDR